MDTSEKEQKSKWQVVALAPSNQCRRFVEFPCVICVYWPRLNTVTCDTSRLCEISWLLSLAFFISAIDLRLSCPVNIKRCNFLRDFQSISWRRRVQSIKHICNKPRNGTEWSWQERCTRARRATCCVGIVDRKTRRI